MANASLSRKLLNWFDAHQRSLPWRRSRDAYAIWVSEVMLQQTTVAAVIPYFERFLKSFPDVNSLAKAPAAKVLKHWEGLGYYRRAKHLHAAAKIIVREHGCEFPRDPSLAKELPGVGRYILGAVLSQAYDLRLPIVEANSLRVLARLFGYRGDPRTGAGLKWTWQAAESLLPRNRAGDFNQAMMELGALVCTVKQPKCHSCPVQKKCEAQRLQLQNEIPAAKTPQAITMVREVAVVIRDQGKLLIGQRPTDASRWAGFWEFPHGEVEDEESIEVAARRIAKQLTGLAVAVGPELLIVKHGVTRFRIEMTAFEATLKSNQAKSIYYPRLRWVNQKVLAALAMSTSQRTLAREASKPSRQKRLF